MPCTKGMTGCKRTCGHRLLVQDYRAARVAQEEQRELDTRGFSAELREYRTLLNFRAYLRGMRRA